LKRVVVISDLHCGHRFGLTHPDFDARPQTPDSGSSAWKRYKLRRKCWRYVEQKAVELQPIDVLIVNGDCIDGKGKKSGATELLTTDRNVQVEMAVVAIQEFKAANVVMSFGTPYHTGVGEDWEKQIYKEVGALKIGGHDWLDVNGLVFDYRHFVSRSSIPHGRHTAVARERLWSLLWAERGEYPKSDIILRSHVHYYAFCGGTGWLAMTTPSLQWYGSKFGARASSGEVDFGFVHFDVESKNDWEPDAHILRIKSPRQQVIKI
jgi:hypothetical protein